ncbi:hypothetical protein EDD15DRAFT_2196557 [Pisolithus albus]|nr:hypothetical protein EDD15DRAFT_2196557 [Pisolithus albus]
MFVPVRIGTMERRGGRQAVSIRTWWLIQLLVAHGVPRQIVEDTSSMKTCRYWLQGFHVERNRMKEDETYFVEIDTELAKQPAAFISFTQLFRFIWERHGNVLCKAGFCSSGPGLIHKNIRAIRLSVVQSYLPPSPGRLLSIDGGDFVAVCWERENKNVGMEIDGGGDEALATDALDLIRSVIPDQPRLAVELLETLKIGGAFGNSIPFHRMLLQIFYFVVRQSRHMVRQP